MGIKRWMIEIFILFKGSGIHVANPSQSQAGGDNALYTVSIRYSTIGRPSCLVTQLAGSSKKNWRRRKKGKYQAKRSAGKQMKTWLRLIGRFKLEECISFGNGRYNSSSSVLGNFLFLFFSRRVLEIYYSEPYVWFSFYPRKPMTPPLFMLAVFGSAIYHFQSETPFHLHWRCIYWGSRLLMKDILLTCGEDLLEWLLKFDIYQDAINFMCIKIEIFLLWIDALMYYF